jgi:hypothetical protein
VTGEDSRYYYVEVNGVEHKLISVTTVLNILSKPALIPWAFKLGVEETLAALHEIEGGIPAYDRIYAAIKENQGTPKDRSGEGASRGTELHAVLESRIAGGLQDIPEDIATMAMGATMTYPEYVASLDKFIYDYEPEWHESELKVVNLELGYAGMLDAVCTIHKQPSRKRHENLVGKKIILDLKTNNEGRVYPEAHFPQIDAYATAYVSMGYEPHDREAILAIGPKTYSVGVNYFEGECFLPILQAYQVLDRSKKLNPNGRKK